MKKSSDEMNWDGGRIQLGDLEERLEQRSSGGSERFLELSSKVLLLARKGRRNVDIAKILQKSDFYVSSILSEARKAAKSKKYRTWRAYVLAGREFSPQNKVLA